MTLPTHLQPENLQWSVDHSQAIELLKRQLEKDLEITLQSDQPTALAEEVWHYCLQLLAHSTDRLQAALYRADVSEEALAKAFREKPWPEAELIAWCILRREWQKVQFRLSIR